MLPNIRLYFYITSFCIYIIKDN